MKLCSVNHSLRDPEENESTMLIKKYGNGYCRQRQVLIKRTSCPGTYSTVWHKVGSSTWWYCGTVNSQFSIAVYSSGHFRQFVKPTFQFYSISFHLLVSMYASTKGCSLSQTSLLYHKFCWFWYSVWDWIVIPIM